MTLREYLKSRGLRQYEFAAMIGVEASSVSRFVRGVRTPRGEILCRILDTVGGDVSLHELMRATPNA